MRIQYPFRLSGRAGRIAHGSRLVLIEIGINKIGFVRSSRWSADMASVC